MFMKTTIGQLQQAVRILQCICVVVGVLQPGSAKLLRAADAPIDRTKLLGVYPRSQPLILKTASNAFAAFRDGSKVVCADNDVAELWDMTTGNKLLSMKHPEVVIGVAIAPDEKTLLTITAGRENPVRLWNLENGKVLQEYPSPFRNIAGSVPVEKDGRSGWNLWDSPTIWRFSRSGYLPKTGFGFTSIAFSTNGQEFATGSEDGTVILWNTKAGKEMTRMVGKAERLWSIVFSPDGTRLLTSSWNGRVALWDTKKKILVKQFEETEGREHVYTSLPFSSDGKRFIFYSSKRKSICDVETGEEVRRLPKSISVSRCIALLPGDDKLLCQDGHLLEVYDIATGKVVCRHIREFGVHLGYAYPNVVYVDYLPNIAAVMAVEIDNDENTSHEDWTTISIVPLSEFRESPSGGKSKVGKGPSLISGEKKSGKPTPSDN